MRYLFLLLLVSFNTHAGLLDYLLNGELLTNGSLGSDICSSSLQINQSEGFSIQGVATGAVVDGTLKLQASNDNTHPNNIVNWVDIVGASIAISGPGVQMFNVNPAMYKYVRACFVWASGTGAITINYNLKVLK